MNYFATTKDVLRFDDEEEEEKKMTDIPNEYEDEEDPDEVRLFS